jgi:raffinose/stachyose/melibiose transport system permease protein
MTLWQFVLAFIGLTILPAIVMFVVAQRHIVPGLTVGAVKGCAAPGFSGFACA